MDSDARVAWWQLDPVPVQQLVHELQVAAEAVRGAAHVLVRHVPIGAGLAVEAQQAACLELAAQARTAVESLADAATELRGWLADFEVRRRERTAAASVLSRELGRPVDPTPQDVRQALASLTNGTASELGPVTSGLLAVAYHRLREIDEDWRAADAAAARRLTALLVPSAPPIAQGPDSGGPLVAGIAARATSAARPYGTCIARRT